MFFYTLFFIALYMAIRGYISFFFTQTPAILAWGYILSHVFLALAAGYLARFSVTSFFSARAADKVFYIVLFLFAVDIAINILVPNDPLFNRELNIIEWGTNKYVGILHTVLLWLVFLSAGVLFAYKAVQNRKDREIRTRSVLIASGILLGIVIVIPRNIFHDPAFLVVSDIGYALSFGVTLLGVSYHFRKKNGQDENHLQL